MRESSLRRVTKRIGRSFTKNEARELTRSAIKLKS